MSPESRLRQQISYYNWKELRLGGVVRVYNRDLFLYDCDAFTRDWYKSSLKPIPVDFDMSVKRPEMIVPPNGNFGSEEDSLLNVKNLVPKRPLLDYNHFLSTWSKIFRFTAQMVPIGDQVELPGPHDATRNFILFYHLSDQSISIYEQQQQNSGMKFLERNKFLERTKVRKPRSEDFFSDSDLYVGATLNVFNRGFNLLGADEYTMMYMEQQAREEEEAAAAVGKNITSARYPWASFAGVFTRIVSAIHFQPEVLENMKSHFMRQDRAGTGYLSKEALQAALCDSGIEVTLHETTTLVRQLGADRQGVVVEQLVNAIEDYMSNPANSTRLQQSAQPVSQGNEAYMAAPNGGQYAGAQQRGAGVPYQAMGAGGGGPPQLLGGAGGQPRGAWQEIPYNQPPMQQGQGENYDPRPSAVPQQQLVPQQQMYDPRPRAVPQQQSLWGNGQSQQYVAGPPAKPVPRYGVRHHQGSMPLPRQHDYDPYASDQGSERSEVQQPGYGETAVVAAYKVVPPYGVYDKKAAEAEANLEQLKARSKQTPIYPERSSRPGYLEEARDSYGHPQTGSYLDLNLA
eukprot:gene14431-20437_t